MRVSASLRCAKYLTPSLSDAALVEAADRGNAEIVLQFLLHDAREIGIGELS